MAESEPALTPAPLAVVPVSPSRLRAVVSRRRPTLEVVIPIYNEQGALEASVRRVSRYLRDSFPFACRVTIADNASTDASQEIGTRLALELDDVDYLRLDRKGRGLALRPAWLRSDAEVVAYMDVDLSTDLNGLWPLVAPLLSGHSELAIGTRLDHGSRVTRGRKREVISRCYNWILRATLHAGFSDAQCGFKAARRDAVERLVPAVADDSWFFDTELLVLAERAGMRIYEVPVDWVDDADSRVDILSTAIDDLRGVWRLGSWRRPRYHHASAA